MAVAAAAAADRAGSEVAAVGGVDGAAGRWALLRHRLRVGLPGSWVAGEPVGGPPGEPSDEVPEGLSGALRERRSGARQHVGQLTHRGG